MVIVEDDLDGAPMMTRRSLIHQPLGEKEVLYHRLFFLSGPQAPSIPMLEYGLEYPLVPLPHSQSLLINMPFMTHGLFIALQTHFGTPTNEAGATKRTSALYIFPLLNNCRI